ncbi:sensor domain-containing protein [Streptomyces sp. NPDC047072]|uniref:sensor domain-containing protein n=1 Tax=Streptomyces sp. NPDC047072 TaxID=3154809 RepID=UPI0033CC36CD
MAVAERQRVGRLIVETMTVAAGALGQLVSGLGTAVLAPLVLLWLAVAALTVPLGVGLLLAPGALRALHALAGRERARLARFGPEVIAPQAPPVKPRPALTDPATRREVRWLFRHTALGLPLGLLGFLLPLFAVRDAAFPLYWRLAPKNATTTSIGIGTAHSWPDALAAGLLGVGWIAIILGLSPALARLQADPGRRLLAAGPGADLSLRVAELTSTRAAALDAHATELRRIERSLHDGTQNRIVTVTVLLGAARRMVARDPARADELLERAQSAAEQALAELRTVSRSILPPVLADRGLAGALTGLAAESAVPCRVDVEVERRCAASVEATAYFVVAEALTNIAKHSGAGQATVTVRATENRLLLTITDDGRGGADPSGGTGAERGSGVSGAEQRSRVTGTERRSPVTGTEEHSQTTSPEQDSQLTGPEQQSWATGPEQDSRATDPEQHSRATHPEQRSRLTGPEEQTLTSGPEQDSRATDPDQHSRLTGPKQSSRATHPEQHSRLTSPEEHALTTTAAGGKSGGSGLTGIRRRVAAHDGTFRLTSPPGGPTTLEVDLPCGA